MLDFAIPSSKDDLLSEHSDRYVPRNIVGPDVLPKKYSECINSIRQEGFKYVLDHFDTLVSVLINVQKLSWDDAIKGFCVIRRGVEAMISELRVLLRGNLVLDDEVRRPAANAAKMLVYLATQCIGAFEERVQRIGESRIKKKGAGNTFPELCEWQGELTLLARLFHEMLHLPLVWLWDPPVPSSEEAFFHLLGNMSFTLLENPAIITTKLADVKEAVLHMLGLMVNRYNYKISIVLRLSDALTRTEHSASVVASAVALLQSQYGCPNAIREVVKEVVEAHSGEVLPLCARNHGLFLGELAELAPAALMDSLPCVLPLLQSPHVAVRTGVLSAMCAIVLKCLSGSNLTVALQRQRDDLLDSLLDYVYDANAFVRAKVVSLWRRLVEEDAVPQEIRCEVLEAVGGRILDAALSVRKASIQLVTLFLERNPALAATSKEAEKLEEEKSKLQEMKDRFREGNPRDMQWLQMQPFVAIELQEYFEENVKEVGEAEEVDEMDGSEGNDEKSTGDEEEGDQDAFIQRVHKELCMALDTKDVVKALKCVSRIEHLAPSHLTVAENSEIKAKVDFYLYILGFFYKYETLTTEALAKSMLNVKDKEEQEMIKVKELYVQYLEASLMFMHQVRSALTHLESLLRWTASRPGGGASGSAESAATVDGVRLAQVAHGVGVPGADACMRALLCLLLHEPDAAVLAAVADGAREVYLQTEATAGLGRVERAVANLLALLDGLTAGEARALEALVQHWLKEGVVPSGSVQALWELAEHPEGASFPPLTPLCPRRRRLLALELLRMAAPANPQRLLALASATARALGAWDPEAAAAACAALAAACPPKAHAHGAPAALPHTRLPLTHALFETLAGLLSSTFTGTDAHFVTLAVGAVDLAYAICLTPEEVVERWLKDMLNTLEDQKAKTLQSFSPCAASQIPAVEARALGRFVAVAGHVAMMQMLFMDTAVYSKIKSIEEKEKAQKSTCRKKAKQVASKKRGQNNNPSDSPSSLDSASSAPLEVPQETEEATQAEDRVSESIRLVCEQDMFSPKSLLGQILPLVVEVLSKPKTYDCAALQRSALLALAKMMMVSSSVCQDHIQLFVTIMAQSQDPETRAQAIISVADITLRFPNCVEPWSKHIYARLQDSSGLVRLTTILILSRLVMCDMIKVRGQISDLALCVCDSNPSIADASRAFFSELSLKHNMLYNVLPDIISGLCASSLPEEKFNEITSFVFGLIKKDKQVEVLVEKLCQRFQLSTSERHASYIAFCLTLLHYSPKALARLTDQMRITELYAEKLRIDKVHQYFQTIISAHSKAGAKPEMKAAAEELATAVDNILHGRKNSAAEGEEDEDGAPVARGRVQRTPRNTRSTPRKKGTTPASSGRSARKPRRTTNKLQWSSSEDEEAALSTITE